MLSRFHRALSVAAGRPGTWFSIVFLAAAAPTGRAATFVADRGGSTGPGLVQSVDDLGLATNPRFGPANEGLGTLSAAGGRIYVAADVLGRDTVYAFTPAGAALGRVAPWVSNAQFGNVVRAADGALYTTMYDEALGQRLIVRLSADAITPVFNPNAGGLTAPDRLALAPDGTLFVSDPSVGIARFDLKTGTFLAVHVPNGRAGLSRVAVFAFGPDGALYVASAGTKSVLRFDAATGAYVDTFVPAGSGGLDQPAGLSFTATGDLLVTSAGTREVLRFDGRTGAFAGIAYRAPAPARLGDVLVLEDPANPGSLARRASAAGDQVTLLDR